MSEAKNTKETSPVKLKFGYEHIGLGKFSAAAEFERNLTPKKSPENIADTSKYSDEQHGRKDGLKFLPEHDAPDPKHLLQSRATAERNIAANFNKICGEIKTGVQFFRDMSNPTLLKDEIFPQELSEDVIKSFISSGYGAYINEASFKKDKIAIDYKRHQTRYNQKKSNYEEFRNKLKENGIERDVQEDNKAHIATFMLLACLIVDMCFTYFVFTDGGKSDLFNGFSIAILLPMLNIGSGFCVGFFLLRRFVTPNKWEKLYGLTAVLGFSLLLLFNFLVSHVREVASHDLQVDTIIVSVAFKHMLSSPLGYKDFVSFLVFLIGASSAAIAMFEGYCGVEDPIIFYSKKHRDYLKAKEKLEDLEDNYLDQRIRQIYSPLASALRSVLVEITDTFNHERKKLELLRELGAKINLFISQANDDCTSLSDLCVLSVNNYRSTNREARKEQLHRNLNPNIFKIFLNWLLSKLIKKQPTKYDWELISAPPAYFESETTFPVGGKFDQIDFSTVLNTAENIINRNAVCYQNVVLYIDNLIEHLPTTFSGENSEYLFRPNF